MRVVVPPAEVRVDVGLVRDLLRDQHPDLADLPVRMLGSGFDNEVLRLGDDLVVRLPRRAVGARLGDVERRWLPSLAARLTLPVPVPVRQGQPGRGYPWPWDVRRFVPGEPLGARALVGDAGLGAAAVLVELLEELGVPAPPDAPVNPWRGVPLRARDATVAEGLPCLPEAAQPAAARLWDRARSAPGHPGPPVWLHGDLHGLNLLAEAARICGVIDFGDLGAGDPAMDLAVGWLVLDAPARDVLRRGRAVDPHEWLRARGWALLLATQFLRHSRDAPGNAVIGMRALREVLAEDG